MADLADADIIKEQLPEYQKFIDAGDSRWADEDPIAPWEWRRR